MLSRAASTASASASMALAAVRRTVAAGAGATAATGAAAAAAPAGARGMATDDGYLRSKRSFLKSFHFQDSLPRLPLPKLEDTCRKYLEFSQPLVSPEMHAETAKLVGAFQLGEGAAIHTSLELDNKAHPDTSYIAGPWFDMYLENRDPLPLFLTPQLTWKDDPNPAKQDQCARAANMLAASVRFQRSLRAENLAPDVFHTKGISKTLWWELAASATPRFASYYVGYAAGAYALDMSQYSGQFSSTRIPHPGKDELKGFPDADYVIVQRGSHFYKLTVADKSGFPVPEAELEAQLRAIVAAKPGPSYDTPPVGVLTSLNRDAWAAIRPELIGSSHINAETLETIDRSLFVLTLEDMAPDTQADVSRCMLHGSCRNRWFDKSFNLVVCANGKAGVNWEHSWGDGMCMLRYFNEIFDEITAEEERAPSAPAASAPEPLPWQHTPAVVKAIAEAEATADDLVDSAELEVYETESLNNADLKAEKLSPDGTMQMVLQLAHQRMHGYTPSTYESASTAGFKHGRTETIRSATPQAQKFALAFCDADSTRDTRLAVLRAAVDNHSKITRDCLMGQGVDRHLFAMRKLAEKKGLPTPAIFEDPTYATFTDIRLSTSTLASPALDGGGFGPISPRAYSVGYGIEPRGSRFHVMTNKLGTKEFVEHIETALRDIRACIYNTN